MSEPLIVMYRRSIAFVARQRSTAQTTAFVGGRVIDGTGRVIENGTIVVRDGKIIAVGPVAATTRARRRRARRSRGKTILPGLSTRTASRRRRRHAQRSQRLHARESAAPAPDLREVRRDHGLQPRRRPGGGVRAAQREGARARSRIAAVRGRPGDRRQHRRRGARDDRQGRRDEARPAEDPRRRQSRLAPQDAGGGVARGHRARAGAEAADRRLTSTGSPMPRRRCSPAPT